MDVLQSFGVFGVFAADGPLGWRGVLASAAAAERGVGILLFDDLDGRWQCLLLRPCGFYLLVRWTGDENLQTTDDLLFVGVYAHEAAERSLVEVSRLSTCRQH